MSPVPGSPARDVVLVTPAPHAPPAEATPLPVVPAEGAGVRATRSVLWLLACVLLATAHVLMAGYRLGVGNQTIQIPFIKKYIADDASIKLFENDQMVGQTIDNYPSYFFKALAVAVKAWDVAPVYLALHFLTAFAVLAGAYALCKAIFRDGWTGLVMIAILFFGHHRALAGDEMYSVGFTHTWFVFPLAIFAMVLLYRGWTLAAFLLAGFIFNLHALTSAYLAVMFGFWGLLNLRTIGWRKLLLCCAAFGVVAVPTLYLMLQHRQSFDAQWVFLTRVRSPDHSFPTTWWQTNTADVPRMALLLGLFALSLSFPAPENRQRTTLALVAAVLILFVEGFVFSELLPVPVVMRAQLFRSSRLLQVLLFAHIAWGIVQGFRGDPDKPRPWYWPLEILAAALTLIALSVKGLVPLLPIAFAVTALVALLAGRLSWLQALVVGAVGVVVLMAWHQIQFAIPGLRGETLHLGDLGTRIGAFFDAWRDPSNLGLLIALLSGVGLWVVSRLRLASWANVTFVAQGALVCILLFATLRKPLLADQASDDPWVDVQRWAATSTPAEATFLTPPDRSGFRMYSDRSVVGEWRDGTQMYFTATYGKEWYERMQTLRPGIMYNEKGTQQLSPGKALVQLDDNQIIALARQFKASHIVLPADGRERNLKSVYANDQWAVYTPQSLIPEGVVGKDVWLQQLRFMDDVVLPNIEKHRKGDVRVELLDPAGRPLAGVAYDVRFKRHRFGFGASLPFFGEVPEGQSRRPDHKPAPITDEEKRLFLEVFNYSVIPFSSKWCYIEPEEGQRTYRELDRHVDWLHENGIEMEFHYLSGLPPMWAERKSSLQIRDLYHKHCFETVERYKDKVRHWQVVNDEFYLEISDPVFETLRKKYPNLRLGLSDCTSFYSRGRDVDEIEPRGVDQVRDLKGRKVPLDFFSLHGHSPHGVWPDFREVYSVFEKFEKAGVRVNVSEMMIPLGRRGGGFGSTGAPILGPVRTGQWTPELQADVFEWFFTVCFSHPNCDSVNYWNFGPDALVGGAGMLDADMKPKPSYERVRHLIKERWWTKVPPGKAAGGQVAFRGFHGDYEIAVDLGGGRRATGQFAIEPDGANRVQLKLNGDRFERQ